jgi:siroheme synthase (precorrin-2 oxidase/ferrochelatase)
LNTLAIGLHVAGWRALVVGEGEAATERRERLVAAGADVHLVPAAAFSRADCAGCRLVMVTDLDPAVADLVEPPARAAGALFYAQDRPARSDFAMPALVTRGPVQIAISTGGRAPALASRLRVELERLFDDRLATHADQVAAARASGGPAAAKATAARLRIRGDVDFADES